MTTSALQIRKNTDKPSEVARLGDKVAKALKDEGVSLEELLATLEEERQRYYQEHYTQIQHLPQ